MRFCKIQLASEAQGDLTPMIDMTFQLIAFFMVLINFTEADQNERIKLPTSEIVKPPDGPLEEPIFLHLTKEGTVILGGTETALEGARANLIVEARILQRNNSSPGEATVIIRADAAVAAGEVQRLIKICQEAEFENFALRAERRERIAWARQSPPDEQFHSAMWQNVQRTTVITWWLVHENTQPR